MKPQAMKKINKLSLRVKLSIGTLTIVSMLALFGLYLFVQLSTLHTSFLQLNDRYIRQKNVLSLELENRQLSSDIRTYVLNSDPKLETDYDATSAQLDSTLQQLQNTSEDTQEKQALTGYRDITSKLQGTELLILSDVRTGNTAEARNLLDVDYETRQTQAAQYVTDLVNNESLDVSNLIDNSSTLLNTTEIGLSLALLALMFIVGISVRLFTVNLVRSIFELNRVAIQFTLGNLTARVVTQRKDEIGSLADEFNSMAVQIKKSYNELEKEKTRFLSSINSLDVGFLMTFLDTTTLSYNPALSKILDVQSPLSMDIIQEKIKGYDLKTAIANCQKTSQHFTSPEVSCNNRILSISGFPIMALSHQTLGTVVLIEDVTEAKIQERSKDEFFSIASHELRTPLTSIKGNTSMILEYYQDALKDPQLKEMVADVHESSVRLIEIVNDFLDLSRLEQSKVTFIYEPVSTEEIIESVAYEMKTVLDEKHLSLKLDKMTLGATPKVWADKNRLKQVFYNLIGNAAKFTDQ
jgi:signal transduction histidine kinase